MPASPAHNKDLASELQELRDRVKALEKQENHQLSVNQADTPLRCRTPTLEPVQEEENEDSFHSRANVEASEQILEEEASMYPKGLQRLHHKAKYAGKSMLKKAIDLLRPVRNADCGTLAPKRMIQQWELKRLRKQWRAEINARVPVEQRLATTTNLEESNAINKEESESVEYDELKAALANTQSSRIRQGERRRACDDAPVVVRLDPRAARLSVLKQL